MNNEKINSVIKLSNNSSFVILIFVILKLRNIGRSTFRHSKYWPPPNSMKKEKKNACNFICIFNVLVNVTLQPTPTSVVTGNCLKFEKEKQ